MVFLKSYLQQINAIYRYAFCFIPDIFKKKKTFKVISDISLKSQYLYFLLLKRSEIVFSKLDYSISCVAFICFMQLYKCYNIEVSLEEGKIRELTGKGLAEDRVGLIINSLISQQWKYSF